MKIAAKLIPLILLPFLAGIFLPEWNTGSAFADVDDFNPEHLDGAFTGGFGEQTCHSCHFDYDLNMEGGSLTVEGIPDQYKPGSEYQVKVTVESEQLEKGGFQMTARFEDGTQAGWFKWESDRLLVTPSISDEIQYVQHSEKGTGPVNEREVSWALTWEAPENEAGKIIINIAANAGNNDDSAFGDWIYTKEIAIKSGE